jgi:FkbM family methyltransferase
MLPHNNENEPFHHYTLRHRITAWISQNVFGNFVYTVRHGLIKGMRRKGGLGWLPEFLSSSVESREHVFWKELDLSGKVVYDIGSFQGLLAMMFSRKAKTVVCFEPNDTNRARLLENLALNSIRNVTVRPVGIGAEKGTATMFFSPLMTGGASIDQKTVSNLQQTQEVRQQTINISTVDEEVASGLPVPDFIKIDIEGYELAALQGARETLVKLRPELFLEMHGETLREKKQKVRAIADLLDAQGYKMLHIETETIIHPSNCQVAIEGHIYATPLAAAHLK